MSLKETFGRPEMPIIKILDSNGQKHNFEILNRKPLTNDLDTLIFSLDSSEGKYFCSLPTSELPRELRTPVSEQQVPQGTATVNKTWTSPTGLEKSKKNLQLPKEKINLKKRNIHQDQDGPSTRILDVEQS